jgi:integrase
MGALRRAGLRRVNIHSLRHSFASVLIMGGAAVTEVQALLGHASPAITLKIYSHWFKTIDSRGEPLECAHPGIGE